MVISSVSAPHFVSETPSMLLDAFSRPARKDATNQNLLRQKLYCLLRSKRGRAQQREAERKGERDAERCREMQRERQREGQRGREAESRGREQRKRGRERDEERECQNPVPFKENYPPPRTCHSLIGCSPSAQLSSRERQSTWRENCPCTCADYLLLRTQLSAPSYNGKCECGSPHKEIERASLKLIWNNKKHRIVKYSQQ